MAFDLDAFIRRAVAAAAIPFAAGVVASGCGSSTDDCVNRNRANPPPIYVVSELFPDGGLPDGGTDWDTACQTCGGDRCDRLTDAGPPSIRCVRMCLGRRYEGSADSDCGPTLGEYLAAMAQLEAESVAAFERLEMELRAHSASAALTARAAASAADERRHARAISALARKHGGRVRKARVPRLKVRPLEAVLLENVTEGCVREAFGALIGTHQGVHATNAAIAAVMRQVAGDEVRHGQLALDVHDELAPRLSTAARAELQRAAISELQSLGSPPRPPPFARDLGLPNASTYARMAQSFRAAVEPALS